FAAGSLPQKSAVGLECLDWWPLPSVVEVAQPITDAAGLFRERLNRSGGAAGEIAEFFSQNSGGLPSWLSAIQNLAGMDGNRTHSGRVIGARQTVLKTAGGASADIRQWLPSLTASDCQP